jgi:hypothetical protein
MNIRAACSALIVSGWLAVAAPSSLSLAQSNDAGLSAKDRGASVPKRAVPNTNATPLTPRNPRYWRHRGGKHPHFGSRRVRT